MGQKLKIAGWIGIGVVTGAMTTVSLQTVARNTLRPAAGRDATTGGGVWHGQSDYVEPVDEKKLITEAISGMISSLDPIPSTSTRSHSKNSVKEGTSGKFVGVGIEITQEDGLVKVVSPIEGSPAFRAGLKPNDLITRVDDTAVKGLTLNEAVKRMRGEPNTKVVLTVFRKDENRTFTVTIVREEIKQQSVRARSWSQATAGFASASSRNVPPKTLCANR